MGVCSAKKVHKICSLCFSNMSNLFCVVRNCNHQYCELCIVRWMQTYKSCPQCQKQIVSLETQSQNKGSIQNEIARLSKLENIVLMQLKEIDPQLAQNDILTYERYQKQDNFPDSDLKNELSKNEKYQRSLQLMIKKYPEEYQSCTAKLNQANIEKQNILLKMNSQQMDFKQQQKSTLSPNYDKKYEELIKSLKQIQLDLRFWQERLKQ